jgi:hypothetical protein
MKQFAVACVHIALKECGYERYSVSDISSTLKGREVGEKSVQTCVDELSFIMGEKLRSVDFSTDIRTKNGKERKPRKVSVISLID